MRAKRFPKEITSSNTLNVYPNPLVYKATAELNLKGACNVRMELWNTNGTKITTIYQGGLLGGKHQFEVRKENLVTGIYFLRMFCNKEEITSKIFVE